MTPSPHAPRGGSDIRKRVLLLARRWLPMLLSRIGVAKFEAEKLRSLDDDSELELDLAVAHEAVKLRASALGERQARVSDALETIEKLCMALECAEQDPRRAHSFVDEVDRQWLRIVLFGARENPGEISFDMENGWGRAGLQLGSATLH